MIVNAEQAYEELRRRTQKEGVQQGQLQGMQQIVRQILMSRFGDVTARTSALLDGISTTERAKWAAEQALSAASLSAFEQALADNPGRSSQ